MENLDNRKIMQLIGLVKRGKIAIENIKDLAYKNAVKAAIGA